MTKKSCDDINAALALDAGWRLLYERQILPENRTSPPRLWLSPYDGSHHEHPPDFCGDSKYTGPLLEKLSDVGVVHFLKVDNTDEHDGCYVCGLSIKDQNTLKVTRRNYEGDTLPKAIARAAKAMLEEKG